MATLSLTPTPKSNLTQAYSLNSNSSSHIREASFSSYLNPSEEKFVNKLAQSSRSLGVDAKPQEFLDHHLCLGSKEDDGEIGVFEAEKYFNGVMDPEESPRKVSPVPINHTIYKKKEEEEEREEQQDNDIVIEPMGPIKLHAPTPSIISESSMNSQSALLRRITRNPSQRKAEKVRGRGFLLAALGCTCSCSDGGSVDVDENVGHTSFNTSLTSLSAKTNTPGNGMFHSRTLSAADPWISEEKIQSQKQDRLRIGKRLAAVQALVPEEQAKPRKSLEVFGSPLFGNKDPFSLEKRLTMLTWDASGRKEELDTDSDASSDLFEIESLTGRVNSFLTRQTSDATSDCCATTPTTARYAPSEASIEWSVVTASAADFSVMSDFEDMNYINNSNHDNRLQLTSSTGATKAVKNDGVGPRRRSGGTLLGCKSQKAVRVAGDALRSVSGKFHAEERVDSRVRRGTGLVVSHPVARFQAETRLAGFDLKYGKHGSHLLYVGN